MYPRNGTTARHPWCIFLWVAVALLLVANQAAFRMGVPAAVGATSVVCCGCEPDQCRCGHAHKSVARHCTRTGKSCLSRATPVSHEQAGLIHADWPPTLRAVVTPPVVPPVVPQATTPRTTLIGWSAPPALPPPQAG